MKTYDNLKESLLERVNRIRKVQRIINTQEFELAWQHVTLQESHVVEAMISLNQSSKLQAWLDSKCQKTLDDMNLKELRVLASMHSVPYYAAMTKATLIWEIENAIATNGKRDGTVVSLGQHRPR